MNAATSRARKVTPVAALALLLVSAPPVPEMAPENDDATASPMVSVPVPKST